MNGRDAMIQAEKEMQIIEKERDKRKKWEEVMQLAEEYGFIRFAYVGFAMLSIDEEAMNKK